MLFATTKDEKITETTVLSMRSGFFSFFPLLFFLPSFCPPVLFSFFYPSLSAVKGQRRCGLLSEGREP